MTPAIAADAPVPAERHKLFGVQYLRAIAALMVAYVHLAIQVPAYQAMLQAGGILEISRFKSGVDIFFVISGFIMFVTSRNTTPGDFAARRIIRIVPLYWLLTLALIAALWLRPDFFRETSASPVQVLKSMLFIPYANPTQHGEFFPILVPGWTLNFEMFFYAIFTLILFAPPSRRLILCGAIFAAVFVGERLFSGAIGHSSLAFYDDPRIFEFWGGMLIGQYYVRPGHRLGRLFGYALAIGGLFLLIVDSRLLTALHWPYSESMAYIPGAFAVVLGTVTLESNGGIRHHWLPALLGDASYSIYLSHIFSLGVARVIWTRWSGQSADVAHAAAFAIFGMLAATLGGILVYRCLEKPIIDILQARYRRRRRRGQWH